MHIILQLGFNVVLGTFIFVMTEAIFYLYCEYNNIPLSNRMLARILKRLDVRLTKLEKSSDDFWQGRM